MLKIIAERCHAGLPISDLTANVSRLFFSFFPRRKIKSSGYAQAKCPQKLFQPKTDFGKKKPPAGKGGQGGALPKPDFTKSRTPKKPGSHGASLTEPGYPLDSGPPSELLSTHAIAGAQVTSICMSGSGRSVVALQSDKLVNVIRLPSADPKDMRSFTGHTDPLVSASWSVDSKYLLTASNSGARVWDLSNKGGDAILTLAKSTHNFKPKPLEPPNEPIARGAVCGAQLYYMDKFVLLGVKNAITLYKFKLDATVDDLKRHETKSRYRDVVTLAHPGTQQITTFAAANTYYSCVNLDISFPLFF